MGLMWTPIICLLSSLLDLKPFFNLETTNTSYCFLKSLYLILVIPEVHVTGPSQEKHLEIK